MADDKIQFLLNNRLMTLSDLDPNTSILHYLRNVARAIGTKEGCGSGDCGACTVVVAQCLGRKLEYKSINACISLVSSLHGKQLITVENLQDGERLHPVQQAMVDHHGSQCGFCTPGFVMSLFALHKNYPEPERAQILEALAGNLCRCTGYRAIIAAAVAAKNHGPDQFDRNASQTIAVLKQIRRDTMVSLTSGDQQAFSPASLAQLGHLMSCHPNARLLAGGTDLVLEISQMHKSLGTIIYLGNVPELQQFEENDHEFVIGAALPYSEFSSMIASEYQQFAAMIERIGSLQIRNLGTLGGNIANASPIGDTPPVLLALDAKLNLNHHGSMRCIPIADYFVDYKVTSQREGEFIQSIVIPKAKPDSQLKVYKVSKRFDDDISAVLAAFNFELAGDVIKNARIAFGGMAALPKRAVACELALIGKPLIQASIDVAMSALATDFTPMSDARASADYRTRIAQNLLQKAFIELSQPGVITGVVQYA